MPRKIFRVTGEPRMVRDPSSGVFVVPDRTRPYEATDPLVIAYPDMFAADSDTVVEQATRAPGERRNTQR
jgi:hypothetical protein